MFILLGLILFAYAAGDTWAVLVAGSNTYSNFRHQADVCEAYQQLHTMGIPDDKIIVWMYDDIANNPQNPKKGSMINYPGGPNVYPGVPKDYTGADVIPKNFLKMLKGEDMTGIGSGKSLKSGPDDRIFLYFTDHGGPGIICFPGFIELGVNDLMNALETLHGKNMYKQMVFYMEACESGSMFYNHLKEEWNIYGVTASNPTESSWACDYSSDYDTYLNDCWSNDWMADSRAAMSAKKMDVETLLQQFDAVQKVSTKSPECKYGDFSFINETLVMFQGTGASEETPIYPVRERTSTDRVEAKNVRREILKRKGDMDAFEEYVQYQTRVDIRWDAFARMLNVDTQPKRDSDDTCTQGAVDGKCMMAAIGVAKKHCGSFDDYSHQYYDYLNFACQQGVKVEMMEKVLKEVCYIA